MIAAQAGEDLGRRPRELRRHRPQQLLLGTEPLHERAGGETRLLRDGRQGEVGRPHARHHPHCRSGHLVV